MINNLLPFLTYENIYLLANWGVIPFWLLLIILPNHNLTTFFTQSVVVPLLLGAAYSFVAYDIFKDQNILDSFDPNKPAASEGLKKLFNLPLVV